MGQHPGDSVPLQLEARLGRRRADAQRTSCSGCYDGAVKSAQIVEFLKALRAHLRRKLLIVWDGAAQHKSRIVRDYLDSTQGAMQMALLPGYAPGPQPGRIPVGLAQAPCTGQLLPTLAQPSSRTPLATSLRSAQQRQLDHHRVLEAGRAVVMSWVT